MHHLSIAPRAKPVKQKLRKTIPHVAIFVKIELKIILDIRFIQPIDYAEWISNIVPISKLDKSIKICAYFIDLNKAYPKDDFPLPSIDTIVHLIAGHAILSLMESFSSYNQIKIELEDQDKTIFTCPWGTYFWNVMAFGLKNAGATYQWEISIIFHDIMHTFMEDCVDDLLVKSFTREGHLEILEKIFQRLEQFNVRLNPKKCVFGVTSGKILGYIVSKKGIEVDPTKV